MKSLLFVVAAFSIGHSVMAESNFQGPAKATGNASTATINIDLDQNSFWLQNGQIVSSHLVDFNDANCRVGAYREMVVPKGTKMEITHVSGWFGKLDYGNRATVSFLFEKEGKSVLVIECKSDLYQYGDITFEEINKQVGNLVLFDVNPLQIPEAPKGNPVTSLDPSTTFKLDQDIKSASDGKYFMYGDGTDSGEYAFCYLTRFDSEVFEIPEGTKLQMRRLSGAYDTLGIGQALIGYSVAFELSAIGEHSGNIRLHCTQNNPFHNITDDQLHEILKAKISF